MQSVRHRKYLRQRNCNSYQPVDPFDFLQSELRCFELNEVLTAGLGSLVSCPSKRYGLIINYRGKIKTQNRLLDNVYSIYAGSLGFLVATASDTLDCVARRNNDLEDFHVQDCSKMKTCKGETTSWSITFFTAKSNDVTEELQYSYGAKKSLWRNRRL